MPISERPLNAATCGSSPSAAWRSMFSSTTIESSTKMPMISVIASSETVSSVKFSSFIAASVTSSEAGIAIITTIALRHDRRKKSITMPVMAMASTKRANDAGELLLRIGRLDVLHRELHVRKLSLKFRQLAQAPLGMPRLRWCSPPSERRARWPASRDRNRTRAAVRIRRSLCATSPTRSKRLDVPNALVESPDEPPLEVPSSSSATDCGVVTSPRMSIDVSRFGS